ncbi:MAG: VWA domain-containing protein [Rhodobacteraceae bacterium]|nr:VWA domain-containing protein [Paracoccaceae bacterium]
MTDPLDHLKHAFEQATPAPDAARKQANLARAEEIFTRTQGSPDAARPIPDRPKKRAGLITGVGQMLSTLTRYPGRAALTASTALVAVGLVAFMPMLRQGSPGVPGFTADETGTVISQDRSLTDRERSQVETDAARRDGYEETEMVLAEEAPAPEPIIEPTRPSLVQVQPKVVLGSPNNRSVQPAPATGGVEISGSAEMGILGSTDDRVEFHSDVDVTFTMSGESEEGLVFSSPSEIFDDALTADEPNTEEFANEEPNPVKIAIEEPVSTFSIDVDTASYSVVRSSLMNGYLPDPHAVRIEEMVNYFPYDYAAPGRDDGPFKPTVTISPTPWNQGTRLMHIALQGQMPAVEDRPALNLVFLIDTSGSMGQTNKLPLLKQSFRLMLGQLNPQDEVSIVTYAGSAGRVLDPTPASDRATILAALDRLDAGGSTAGQAGLQQAYATAESMAEDGEVTRVILATDGDFNVGIHNPEELEEFIAKKRDSGTYLSVLGFGRGNLDDATMQALAQNGNGTAAYIDTLSEAQKVLVDQLTGALFPIANDVKIQVEFNPAQIAEYRLIGYETRALAREDFNNDKVDAGEIGAGHSVTAIYEITPVGSPAVLNDPLRYTAGTSDAQTTEPSDELAFLRLRYKDPGAETSQLIELPITASMGESTPDTVFASAIAGFGQLLKDGNYTGEWGWAEAIALAETGTGDDPFGYRREAVTMMRLAQSLSE